MNERILELAIQAKAFIVEPEQAKIGEVSEVSFDKYSDLEKFAELIVRECADLLELEYGQSVLTGNKAAEFVKNILE